LLKKTLEEPNTRHAPELAITPHISYSTYILF
jgi:hypothetical protein